MSINARARGLWASTIDRCTGVVRAESTLDHPHPKSALSETTTQVNVLESVAIALVKPLRYPKQDGGSAQGLYGPGTHRELHPAPLGDTDPVYESVRLHEHRGQRAVGRRPCCAKRVERTLTEYGIVIEDQRELASFRLKLREAEIDRASEALAARRSQDLHAGQVESSVHRVVHHDHPKPAD